MPTYEYKCTSCGELSEYFQSITAEPKTNCEICGGKLKRLISGGAGPIFKGSGFYQTDYKNITPQKGKSEAQSKSNTETKTVPSKTETTSTKE